MIRLAIAFVLTFSLLPAQAQLNPSTTQIRPTEIRNGIYIFMGAGGNIGVSVGDDGALIVDDQFAEMTAKVNAALAELTDKPTRYVLNTHWHWDHTGGNENYGKAGKTIIAHDNTYARMSEDQFVAAFNHSEPASPEVALPVITFNDEATLRFNDLTIHMVYAANAHTDSDAFVHFVEANVIHSGDVYTTGSYPFIDSSTGGTLAGEIAAVEKLVNMIDYDTVIIPGHGPLSDKVGALKTLTMLKGMRDVAAKAVTEGMSLEAFLDSNPSAPFDDDFAIRADAGRVFATRVYLDMTGE